MATHRTLKLTKKEQAALEDHRDHAPQPAVRERCAAILKVAAGEVAHWVARQGLLKPRDPDTVYHWLDLYEAEGLAGVLAHRQGGPRRQSETAPPTRQAELEERLPAGPGPEAAQVRAVDETTCPVPGKWTLATIRASFDWLEGYTLSGVWRVLERFGLGLHTARGQMLSPDPDYLRKKKQVERVLRLAAREPGEIVALFLDEFGFCRWPEPTTDWGAGPGVARRAGNNQQWRTVGVLNALTGQVNYLDGYIVGRQQLGVFYQQLDAVYAKARQVYIMQDNWSIHSHPDVLAGLAELPRLRPVWLPTYSPWLNPAEKLWRWVRQDVLKLHRWVTDWERVKQNVRDFLEQFDHGSEALLQYVGLLGEGRFASVIRNA